MSFMEPRSDINICNKALSRIGQTQLTGTLDAPTGPNNNASRECRLHYKSTVRAVLEMHHWNLATQRQTLVENTNERSLEWPFSYAVPPHMAFPVNLHVPGSSTTAPVSYYRGLGGLIAKLYGRPYFTFSGNVIYSVLGPAEVEFTSFDISEQQFSQELEDVIVLYLAAKLAYSIAKDHKMGNEIKQEAISQTEAAIARNLNQQQPRYDQLPSESELARQGVDPWMSGFVSGYPL